MRHRIVDQPDFSFLELTFDTAGESIVAESGAMVARDAGVQMKTGLRGGLLASAKRKLLGGESLFLNTFTAASPHERLMLAPAAEGDILLRDLHADEPLFVRSGGFLAAAPTVTIDTKWGGAKGFFGAGLFLLKAQGTGPLFLSAFGGVRPVQIDPASDGFIVDNDHIVAFTTGLDYKIRKIGGLKGLFFSGEGLVCHFTGTGTVYLQTRNPRGLAAWVHPFRRVQSSR